jgi:hypothetical protein
VRRTTTLALLALLLGTLACGVTEGDFIIGAEGDPCMSNIPICQTTAGCSINEAIYLEGDFPGLRNFVVNTPADTEIEVRIFFKTRLHPGEDTEIRWYEPGCADYYAYESMGIDIFSKAGSDRVFAQSQKVRMAGDHLIEIYSDATTHYFVRVELTHPN